MTDWQGQPIALVFPGQGAQFVGMGVELAAASPVAAATLHEANEVLGFDLINLMTNGPVAELEDTFNAQPAILAVSVAVLRAIEDAWGTDLSPSMVAGHSLGEFSALVAADSLTYADGLRLVRSRGEIMKAAGETNPGAMAAVLGLDDEILTSICAEASRQSGSTVVVANRNCPGQTVLSGTVQALELASELAKDQGARRVARLNVSIASHSPLMADAARAFGEIVARTPIAPPRVPVVANGSAAPMTTTAEIVAELSAQMAAPVDWTGSVQTMLDHGIPTFAEFGPGNVLAGLIKRIDREAVVLTAVDFDTKLPAGGK
ncbi:MAG TPA: ACP S-malonyltransferase [Thermomicrobiales bacterium]|nr:ACP S-malonyltransferase [Thermomicrobiales bacterium]